MRTEVSVYDFAISFFRPDRPWAEWIAAMLADRGAQALLLEAGRAFGGSPGPDAVWVPLVSRSAGTPETSPAWWWWWHGPPAEDDPHARPVAVDSVTQPDGASWLDLTALAVRHDPDQVAEALSRYLGVAPGRNGRRVSPFGLSVPRYPSLRQSWWNVPGRNMYFTGRQEALAQVANSLREQPRVPHVIFGPAGVGKTSVAIEYAYRQLEFYRGCWWVDGDLHTQGPGRVLSSAPDGSRRPWLLILDDAIDPSYAIAAARDDCHILVTSGRRAEDRASQQELEPLGTADSVRLASRLLDPQAAQLAVQVGGLSRGFPLAIWIMTYVLGLNGAGQAWPSLIGELAAGGPAPEAAVRAALTTVETASPATADLLYLLAALAPQPMPLAALRAGAAAGPAPLADAARIQPDLVDLAEPLVRAGLLRRDGQHLMLHPVARQVAVERIADRPRRFGQAANLVLAAAHAYRHHPPGDPDWNELLPHLSAVTDLAGGLPAAFPADSVADYLDRQQAGGVYLPDVLGALGHAARHFAMSGEAAAARDLSTRAARFAELYPDGPLADRVARLVSLASYQRGSGRAGEALTLLEEARRLARAKWPIDAEGQYPEFFEQPELLCELVLAHHALGDHDLAVSLAERLEFMGRHGGFGAGFDARGARQVHAAALRGAGRTAEARTLLEECLTLPPLNPAGPDWGAALIEKDLTEVLLDLDDAGGALELLGTCVPQLESWFGSEHATVGEALVLRAMALSALGRPGESATVSLQAITIANTAGTPGLACRAIIVHAEALHAAGRTADAATWHREAIEAADTGHLPARDRAATRQAAANALLKTGAFAEAAEILSEALDLFAETPGTDKTLAITLLRQLAETDVARGDLAAAVGRCQRARALITESPGLPEYVVVDNLVLLGHALSHGGQAAEAVQLLGDACTRAEGRPDRHNDQVARLQAGLALARRKAGDPRAALDICGRAIESLERAAHANPDTAREVLGLLNYQRGAAQLDLGLGDAAVRSFQVAVQAVERSADPTHATLPGIVAEIGMLLLEAGHPAHASSYFRRALSLWSDLRGGDSIEAGDSLDNLGRSWVATGYPHQAIDLHRQAVQALEDSQPESPRLAVRLYNLGMALKAAGRPGQAADALERATLIDTQAYGEGHPEVITDLQALASALDQAGRHDEAERQRWRAGRHMPI